ncbi:MAG: ATP-binding cassette domain-containing protein [Candidatus Ancillula sp.]|jgi:ATPase subunit of ABC transporter with duplicated ATPase domains|nr:ATP-binding cassette domain-containing protein [Candidatus Ancillula sp.]
MLIASDVEIQLGARQILYPTNFRIQKGDKIGLVGRNGAGKTTLTRVLAGINQPTNGQVTGNGAKELAAGNVAEATRILGYLPQDTHVKNPKEAVLDRILSARSLDTLSHDLEQVMVDMASDDSKISDKAMKRYDKVEQAFLSAGGYEAKADAEKMAISLGLPEEILSREIGVLSGGQRRRVELARILFSRADTLLLDEPTNHLDADSIMWLRDFLKSYEGGFLMITHDTELLKEVVNKVYFLDASRSTIDQYNLGWEKYLKQRAVDQERRKRERAVALAEADRLFKQGNKMRASATKAVAARQMLKRAEQLKASVQEESYEKVANIQFPTPQPCGKTPLAATGLSKSYGSTEIFSGADLVIDKGSKVVVLGLNGAGKTTLLKILAGVLEPDTGKVEHGYGLKIGYFAQEHDLLDLNKSVLDNMIAVSPASMDDTAVRNVLGSFMFSGDDVLKPAGVLSGGEKTRLALAGLVVSGANVLLLDEPTNNLDPASREEVLEAIANFQGAIVLVTHDPGATKALNPDRVLLLPDADEDLWNDSYQEIVELS